MFLTDNTYHYLDRKTATLVNEEFSWKEKKFINLKRDCLIFDTIDEFGDHLKSLKRSYQNDHDRKTKKNKL